MATVTINAATFTVYADAATATAFHDGRFGGVAWTSYSNGAETANDKARALVAATDLLELIAWAGTRTAVAPGQPLEWPRSGVTDRDGNGIDSATIPTDVVNACCMLALAILQDPTIVTDSAGSASNVKRIEAKGTGVEYFAPVDGSETTRLPSGVWERIAYLTASATASAAAARGSVAYGADGCPSFGYDGANDFRADREPI